MGHEITLMRKHNGEIKEFYPKTTTKNVVRETDNGEIDVDKLLDDKGAFIEYSEGIDIESPNNDLLFEVVDEPTVSPNQVKKIHGTLVQETEPTDTNYMWVDTSNENFSVLKHFDSMSKKWKTVNINGGSTSPMLSHVGMIIQSSVLNSMDKVIQVYGGTKWEPIEGQFLLGASAEYPINSTGGESEHTLTIDEMPSHTHRQYVTANTGGTYGVRQDYRSDGSGTAYPQCQTGSAGGNGAHNNMPPYKAVYIWERTA